MHLARVMRKRIVLRRKSVDEFRYVAPGADTDGRLINVYQAATQMTDESGQTFPFTIDRTSFHRTSNHTLWASNYDAQVDSVRGLSYHRCLRSREGDWGPAHTDTGDGRANARTVFRSCISGLFGYCISEVTASPSI